MPVKMMELIQVRLILIQAANTAARKDDRLRKFYLRNRCMIYLGFLLLRPDIKESMADD
jgi:hypothetical protein